MTLSYPHGPPMAQVPTPPSFNGNGNQNNTLEGESPQPEYVGYQDLLLSQSATLEQVVQEWEEGFGGRPSILHLESQYNNEWRKESRMKQRYTRRKRVYDSIKKAAKKYNESKADEAAHFSNKAMAKHIDERNTSDATGPGHRTIDWISKNAGFFQPYL